MKTRTSMHCIVGLIAVLLLPGTGLAEDKPVTDQTLLDRIRIEDMMVRYYGNLGKAGGEKMVRDYTEDGVLDVNNMVFTGRDEIEKIYNRLGEDTGEVYQGRDYTKLVKRDGRWLIRHRGVTSDGGTPEYWRRNYVKRSFR